MTLIRRHRLAEHLLIDVIGLPWHQAHHEAERWDRVVSEDVEAGLGATVRVRGVGPDGAISLEVDGTTSALGADLADNLWVEPAA